MLWCTCSFLTCVSCFIFPTSGFPCALSCVFEFAAGADALHFTFACFLGTTAPADLSWPSERNIVILITMPSEWYCYLKH